MTTTEVSCDWSRASHSSFLIGGIYNVAINLPGESHAIDFDWMSEQRDIHNIFSNYCSLWQLFYKIKLSPFVKINLSVNIF